MRARIVPIVIVSLVIALGGVSTALGASPTFKKAHRLTQRGEKALQTGDMKRAREAFESALAIEEGFPSAHLGLGHVGMAASEFDAALAHYEHAINEFSRFGDVVEQVQAQRYRSAQNEISTLRDSISQLSTSSNAQWANMQISKIQLVISRLEVVEPPDPESLGRPPGEYHFYAGNAMFQLGKLDGAIEAWERCRDEKPKFAMVYNNLALAYWKRGRLDEAVSALDRAEELGFPVNPDFRRDLTAAAAKS